MAVAQASMASASPVLERATISARTGMPWQ
jgi:hypothetical protein